MNDEHKDKSIVFEPLEDQERAGRANEPDLHESEPPHTPDPPEPSAPTDREGETSGYPGMVESSLTIFLLGLVAYGCWFLYRGEILHMIRSMRAFWAG